MSKRILIVDDSIFIQEEMKHILTNTDYKIVGYAKCGEEAIKLYEELLPDVLTLDIIMPGMDGLDTAKVILEKWPKAKIVMVSSLAYDETMTEAKNIGACSFIFKPLEQDQLIRTLDRVTS